MFNNKKLYTFAFTCFYCIMSASATETSDSIYANQIISTTISVNTSQKLQAQSVTVTPEGRLTMTSLQSVTINTNFEVNIGGTLVIRTGQSPRIKYTYDACGNRTRREKE